MASPGSEQLLVVLVELHEPHGVRRVLGPRVPSRDVARLGQPRFREARIQHDVAAVKALGDGIGNVLLGVDTIDNVLAGLDKICGYKE